MQVGDFQPGVDPECRVKVGKRLVEQEQLGFADDRPADGNALTLTAGQFRRAAVEQIIKVQHIGGTDDTLVDFRSRRGGLV